MTAQTQTASQTKTAAGIDRRPQPGALNGIPNKMDGKDVKVYYGAKQALKGINLSIPERQVTALIGPSGCGKSTFLRCLNRMNDTIDIARIEGLITLDGQDIYDREIDPVQLRARVGMVFQKPNPFPKSIYDNIAYGPRLHGVARRREEMDEIVCCATIKTMLVATIKPQRRL